MALSQRKIKKILDKEKKGLIKLAEMASEEKIANNSDFKNVCTNDLLELIQSSLASK